MLADKNVIKNTLASHQVTQSPDKQVTNEATWTSLLRSFNQLQCHRMIESAHVSTGDDSQRKQKEKEEKEEEKGNRAQ